MAQTLQCDECARTFQGSKYNEKHKLACHWRRIHGLGFRESRRTFQCDNCGGQYSRSSLLIKHWFNKHSPYQPDHTFDKSPPENRNCDECNWSQHPMFCKYNQNWRFSAPDFHEHFRRRHLGIIVKNNPRARLTCDICQGQILRPKLFGHHLRFHF